MYGIATQTENGLVVGLLDQPGAKHRHTWNMADRQRRGIGGVQALLSHPLASESVSRCCRFSKPHGVWCLQLNLSSRQDPSPALLGKILCCDGLVGFGSSSEMCLL